MHVVLLTLSIVGASPSTPVPESAEALRTRATRLYRAKKYDQACPLFERAAQLAPRDGALLADWGLCLQRWGKEQQALAVNLRALLASGEDPKTRGNIYYNLSAFHDVTPGQLVLQEHPTPSGYYVDGGGCAEIVSSEPSCARVLHGCVVVRNEAEATSFTLRISREKTAAEEGTAACAAVAAPSTRSGPLAESCITWGSQMEPKPPCASGDKECWKAAQAYQFPRRGECKLVYANPCTGWVGVSCWGMPFMSRKAILQRKDEGSAESPGLVGEVNLGAPDPHPVPLPKGEGK